MAVYSVERRTLLVAGVLVLALSGVAAMAVGSGAQSVTAVTYEGDAGLGVDREATFVWQAGQHRFEVALEGVNESDAYEVCLHTDAANGGDHELACRTTEAGGPTRAVEFERSDWPEGMTGAQTLEAEVRRANGTSVLATGDLRLHVLARDGDLDGDGLANEEEVQLGTNLTDVDTDDDGLEDGAEVEEGTDARAVDTDGDGLEDGREREVGTNPNRADTDGDGLDDHAELTVYGTDPTAADTDGDGLSDSTEVHDEQTNPTEADTDGDGLDDGAEVNVHGTDPNTVDTDGDGLSDRAEVETHQTDPTTADTDGDGIEDGAEVNSYDTDPNNADTDGDGIPDGEEIEQGTNPRAVNTEAGGSGFAPFAGRLPDWLPTAVLLLGGTAVAAGVAFLLARAEGRWDPRPWGFGDETSAEPAATDADGAGSGAAEAPTAAGARGTDPGSTVTDEERVLQLLDREDGRMRQSRIVEATGWSKAKVSKVLARMDEADQVVKVSTGRENLIARPGDEPEFVRSSLDESSE